jgi:hypothetical protein
MDTPPIPEHKLFSVGFRCSSAGILKSLGLKIESHPFDWLVSRLDVIVDCIETQFTHFLDVSKYEFKITSTYGHMDTVTDNYICDEHSYVNMHYQPIDKLNEKNTYQHHLAIAHNNITDPTDHSYFVRCIERFNTMLQCKEHKMYLHISPLFVNNVEENVNAYKYQCIHFHDYMQQLHEKLMASNDNPTIIAGLFFILVKDLLEETPKMQILHEWIKPNYGKCKIILLRTNHLFIDGGETFMGNHHEEVELIKHNILHYNNLNDVLL